MTFSGSTQSDINKVEPRPAFFCVGPEKTGTSWLYRNLEPHPEVYLAPVKEIRYFYENVAYPYERWWSRLSPRGDWHAEYYRQYFHERFQYYAKHPRALRSKWRRVLWDWRYLFGRRNDRWYLSLFKEAGQRLVGDISPQYLSLPDEQIVRIRNLLPDLKIIILLRDPIDWSWSFARMSLVGRRNPEEIPDAEFLAFFDRYMDYYPTVSAIHRWNCYFPSRVHVGFYDMLLEDPWAFYGQICEFLGIDKQRTPENVRGSLASRVYEGRNILLPLRFERYLAGKWSEEIKQLCQAFAPHPQKWLERCARVLARDDHLD